MKIADVHCHILPGIDDGSKDSAMTRAMLELDVQQGIEIVVATPHFYADHHRLDRFLSRRGAALELTQPLARDLGIELRYGAEVALFAGMSRAEGMEELCWNKTSLMLVEMPFRPWALRDVAELEGLVRRGITPILAHLERFYPYRGNKRMIKDLLASDLPFLVQINAEALLDKRTLGLVLKLFKRGDAQLLASDAHNLTNRAPNLAAGRMVLEQRLGSQYLDEMDALCEELLGSTL